MVEWGSHTEEHCGACKRVEVQLKGGRPAKQTKGRGRPRSQANEEHDASKAELIAHVDAISTATLKPAGVDWLDPSALHTLPPPLTEDEITCPICSGILDAPLSLVCGHITCAVCLRKSIAYSVGQTCCPCCTTAITDKHTIKQPSRIITASIQTLKVKCPRPTCVAIVTLQKLSEHHASCLHLMEQTTSPQPRHVSTPALTPSAISLRRVLSAPLDQTPTLVEQRTATYIIRRMANSRCERATEQTLRLPTGGQVSKLSCIHGTILV